jgi:hypothetical protein
MVINGTLMRGLAKVNDWPESFRVVAFETELKIGPMTIDAELRAHAPPQLLALNATPKDLVQLHVRESQETVEHAGLTSDVADALKRVDQSCGTAASTLRWLGITSDDLRQWIFSRLGTTEPEPEPQLLVVESTGQVRLFDET